MTEQFIADGAGILQIWFYAILMLYLFNFLKAIFPKEPYFVDLESNVRNHAFYKGLWFSMMMLMVCSMISMVNINFDSPFLAMSATLSAIFMALFIFFPIFHAASAVKYRKLIKNNDIRELAKYKWRLMFGEFADNHYIRYFFMWAFMLRRLCIAYILVFMDAPVTQLTALFFVNLFALLWDCISRPYNDVLINVSLIVNDIGVLIVIGEFYVY